MIERFFILTYSIWLAMWFDIDAEATPREAIQTATIASKNDEIQSLASTLGEVREQIESERKTWTQKEAASLMKLEALEHEVDTLTEMHDRLLLRVKAESAAYSSRLPASKGQE